MTALSILRLIQSPPGRIEEGSIVLHHKGESLDLVKLSAKGKRIRRVRGKEISMIFQEPMTAFTPIYSIGFQILETLKEHTSIDKKEARKYAVQMLRRVGLPDPEQRADAYPHQLSGGMRQRAMIAMALACNPALLLADEPTTALDVTIEAQILGLLKELQRDFHMSILFITHDLGVIAKMADLVIVMYLGQIMEKASVGELFSNPRHPYTRALFHSIVSMAEKPKARLTIISGSVPDPTVVIPGCPFAPRCEKVMETCNTTKPGETHLSSDHSVSCWLSHT